MNETEIPTASESAFGPSPLWAVVEVMGHQRFVGQVAEVTFAGAGFIRIDVPPRSDDPTTGYVKVVGPSSI